MKLYSVTDREAVFHDITALANTCGDIVSAVLVGSGAEGFTDEFSDLDFYMVADCDANIPRAMDDIASGIKERLQILTFMQMPQRELQVYLTGNYLEIDIGYASLDQVRATRKRWEVLFDKTGTVDADMRRTWEQNAINAHGNEKTAESRAMYGITCFTRRPRWDAGNTGALSAKWTSHGICWLNSWGCGSLWQPSGTGMSIDFPRRIYLFFGRHLSHACHGRPCSKPSIASRGPSMTNLHGIPARISL